MLNSDFPSGSLVRSARRRRPGRRGFTLTEVMIALGVMVVGMSMVAAALHAGIQSHITSVDDVIRSLVGENTIAIAKARLRHNSVAAWNTMHILVDADIGSQDRKYPVGRPLGRGYVVYGQRLTAGQNDYKFIVIPYQTLAGDYVGTQVVPNGTFSLDATGVSKIVLTTGIDKLPVGAKVVELTTKNELVIATVTKLVGRTAVLLDKALASGTRPVTVLCAYTATGSQDTSADAVPKFGDAYTGRTALSPQ